MTIVCTSLYVNEFKNIPKKVFFFFKNTKDDMKMISSVQHVLCLALGLPPMMYTQKTPK